MRSNSVIKNEESQRDAAFNVSDALAAPGCSDLSWQCRLLSHCEKVGRVGKQKVLPMVMALLIAFGLSLTPPVVFAEEIEVTQRNKRFSVRRLRLKVGDTVNFVNRDSFSHNIYSLSRTKSFDLGTFAKGNSRKVTFDKPGKIEVECAIHSRMRLQIQVSQ